jgi:hypothetical protein
LARIWDNTRRIYETASAGETTADHRIVITVGAEGGMRIFCDSDWAPESLAREYGACESYVVTRRRGALRVEGRAAGQTCVMQSEPSATVARRMLSNHPRYLLTA